MFSRLTLTTGLQPAIVIFVTWKDVLKKIWFYLTQPHDLGNGNITFSVKTLVVGAVIFAATLLLSRRLTVLLKRRIAKYAYLDPGIQYTLARLTQYLIVAIGVLLALSFGI